jgi:flagellar hook assembly protein FlgD
VLDASGRAVRELADRVMPAGEHSADWDGTNGEGRPVAGGVYFIRLETPGFAGSKKVAVSR